MDSGESRKDERDDVTPTRQGSKCSIRAMGSKPSPIATDHVKTPGRRRGFRRKPERREGG